MAFQETARAAPAIAGSDPRIDERFERRLDETNTTFCQRAEAANRLRLQFLAARLHTLGPKPLFYFLSEIERGAEIRSHLEKYAQLPTDFIKAYHGDRFTPALHAINGRGR